MIETKPIQMVDLKGQFLRIQDEVESGIQEVIRSAAFINGPAVKEFAANLESYLNVGHVATCANGTDALMIALMALGLKPGDEVITSPFTFVATAEVIELLGLKSVFVDIEADSFNLDVSKIEAAITEKTKCIIPVHLYGQGCDMDAIMSIAKKHDLFVVEDNAQSIGASYKGGKKYGSIGHIGCTSFYPSKNLGAYGDAGALFTNDEELADKIRMIANHGQKRKYISDLVGVNSRMDSFQAVVLNAKLKILDEFIADRRRAAAFYDSKFSEIAGVRIPSRMDYSDHVFHQYTLLVDGDRDALKEKLQEAGVPSMIYYPYPLHLHAPYKGEYPDLSISEKMAKQVISLPMHTELDEDQLAFIAETFIGHINQA